MQNRAAKVCIEAPELMSPRERVRDTVATGIMWVLYAYLWLPMISLLAWLLGFEFAYDVMVRAGGAAHLKTVLYWYSVAIMTIFVIFGAWSMSNRWRFAGHNRRGRPDRVTDESFMTFFGISGADLGRLRSGQVLTLELDAVGAICEIAEGWSETSRPPPPGERRDDEGADEQQIQAGMVGLELRREQTPEQPGQDACEGAE
jgi:biofilm PGA synthesis protein PgaD